MKTIRIQKQLIVGSFTFDIHLDVKNEKALIIQVKKDNEILGTFSDLTAKDVDDLDMGFESIYTEIKNLENIKNEDK